MRAALALSLVFCVGCFDFDAEVESCRAAGICASPGGPSPAATSAQLAAARAAIASGVGLPVAVTDAVVTFVKPAVMDAGASDPPGFFVQAEQIGPALFVAVDPSSAGVRPGDRVSLVVTAGQQPLSGNALAALEIAELSLVHANVPLEPLITDVSDVTFDQPGTTLATHESRLVRASGEVVSTPAGGGLGFENLVLSTRGAPSQGQNPPFEQPRLRLPKALNARLALDPGCTLTAVGPMWRFGTTPQPSIFDVGDLDAVRCASPRLIAATMRAPDRLRLQFDRPVVTPSASMFDTGGVAIFQSMALSLREVTFSTSVVAPGQQFTVSVQPSLRDYLDAAIDPQAASLQVTGVACTQQPVVISQVYTAGGTSGRALPRSFVELHNRRSSPVSVDGWSLQVKLQSSSSWTVVPLGGSIGGGQYYLIGLAPSGGTPFPAVDVEASVSVPWNEGASFALSETTTALTGCPAGGVRDLVGFGAGSACALGAHVEFAGAEDLSVQRTDLSGADLHCFDSRDNGADFVVAAAAPRKGQSNTCSCP